MRAGRLAVVAAAVAAMLAPSAGAAPTSYEPLPESWLPDNPYMSSVGANSMHGDSYASDTHPWAGPTGKNPTVTYAGKSPCAGMGVTREGLLLLQCGGAQNFTFRLVDPDTLKDLATYSLPPRPSTLEAVKRADPDVIYSDSSGAYFYLDNNDRVVVADAAQHIQRIAHVQAQDGSWSFRQEDDWDLTKYLPHDCTSTSNPFPSGECDPLTGVLPDWDGLLWFVTRFGRVGTLDPATGKVRIRWLRGEEIENSAAVSEDGVSVVSDHALYQFRARRDGTPYVVWRAKYDRGSRRKVGQINQGSGTTPTFLGRKYVVITDNAEPRMHVNVYRRADDVEGSRLVCSVPVFKAGASATENSLIAYGDGILVENNTGYLNATSRLTGAVVPGGVTKVFIRRGRCGIAWSKPIVSPSVVPKLARGNGLLYLYTPKPVAPGIDEWGLTIVDWRTGRTVAWVKTGTGPAFDNAWAPITLGPKNTAYVSLFTGLVAVRDS